MSESSSKPRFWDLKSAAILVVAVWLMAIFLSDCGYRFTVARLSAERWAEDDGLNDLVMAIQSGRTARVDSLLSRVDVNARDNADYTPLMHAVRAGRLDLCRRLIDRGADLDASTHVGMNALMLAVVRQDESILRLLLSRGAGVDAPTCSGRTALMVACCKGNDELAAVLLQAGANVNATSNQGVTPLIDAVSATAAAPGPPPNPQSLRLIRRLLSAGACINAADRDGATALIEAAREDSAPTIALLRSMGADSRLRDRHGRDALAIARQGECHAAIAALLADLPAHP
jgi:ankyrin repeat protein